MWLETGDGLRLSIDKEDVEETTARTSASAMAVECPLGLCLFVGTLSFKASSLWALRLPMTGDDVVLSLRWSSRSLDIRRRIGAGFCGCTSDSVSSQVETIPDNCAMAMAASMVMRSSSWSFRSGVVSTTRGGDDGGCGGAASTKTCRCA